MSSMQNYICLAGLVIMPVLLNKNQVEAIKERNGSVNAMISFGIVTHFLFGLVLVPMLAGSFLKGGSEDKTVFCIYLGGNIFIQIYLILRKARGTDCTEVCKILKDIWIVGVVIYSILLGKSFILFDSLSIILAACLYVVYNSCALGFECLYEEQPIKNLEERRQILSPLQQEDIRTHRIWLKKKELKKKRKNLILASGFLLICIIFFLLTVAQEVTGLIVVFIVLVYFGGMGTLVVLWNARIKDIENRQIENVFKGKAIVEKESPFQVGYIDSVGEYQHEIVDIRQNRKEKQGTIVDVVVENGKVVFVEGNLRE